MVCARIVGLATALFFSGACGGRPDPRTLEGATAYAAEAIAEGDTTRLYRVIDSRARAAMISIVTDRLRAREIIERSYPEAERAAAVAALCDAAEVRDAPGLFVRRCDSRCIASIRDSLGAPTEVRMEGRVAVVRTPRERELRWYRKTDADWWGLEWNTQALSDERERANRDVAAIEENARTFERRRALEGSP